MSADSIELANTLIGLDFAIETIDGDDLVIRSYIDVPRPLRCRLRFRNCLYIQLRPCFSHRRLVQLDLGQLPPVPESNLELDHKCKRGVHPALPGYAFEDLQADIKEGWTLYVFKDSGGTEAEEPDLFVLAGELVVESAAQIAAADRPRE